jgi:hypothetical protein
MIKQYFFLFVFISISLWICCACNQEENNPEIVIVKNGDLPNSYSDNIYFLYGTALDTGEQNILNNLLQNGFKIKNAWVPYTYGDCMPPNNKEMILELDQPDSRIYSFGFTSDSTQLNLYCITLWKKYKFLNQY